MANSHSNAPEPELLKALLQPLLADFHYWFERAKALLGTHRIDFLEEEEQSNLLQRVEQAQQEVQTAQLLLKMTDGRVGVDTAILLPWHKLVTECWQVGMRFRSEHPELNLFSSSAPDALESWDSLGGTASD
ncbi:MAG: DUF2605 domain-containing protein [Synechococcales cyanobacterium C42_A2020_086]|jgi:hypothetical protein|nr:DUF2605 domain-containing protein [Synechococcales cyanobacterium M58_A2018_015]MBF2074247.1 DUF2605 domain-containing protein [Synechococcales cyanobacterium C42_A2020_086]